MKALTILRRHTAAWVERRSLPAAARAEADRDRAGLRPVDPGPEAVLEACANWLCRAQDRSASADGGVARHYSLIDGWSASYPETTGYIVPTMLAWWRRSGDERFRDRARRMADWLVSIQFPDGGFQGGLVDSRPRVPVAFNTGQILLGLAAAAAEFGEPYVEPMRMAAEWLVATQDADGCWRRHPSPWAGPGDKVYDTHIAWGLVEAARVHGDHSWAAAAGANVDWALEHQQADGWFADCCLDQPAVPLTHTLGYALRGVIEVYRHTGDPALLAAARRSGDGLAGALGDGGLLPGRLGPGHRAAANWVCLTGSAQVAHCWLMLAAETGDLRYREAASAALRFVRRTVCTGHSDADRVGAVKGSFPVDGGYGRFQYLNWACKFLMDALMLETGT